MILSATADQACPAWAMRDDLPAMTLTDVVAALLVVDEIGYLPVSQDGAVLFFQLVNARHERASTVLTSNRGFEEWGCVLGDEVTAAELIDRLVHHCHIVKSYGTLLAAKSVSAMRDWGFGRIQAVTLM